MTDSNSQGSFYVAIAAEADEPDLVADIVFAGQQIADVRLVDGSWLVTLYDPFGAEGYRVPLDGLRDALDDAAKRLKEQ